MKLVFCIALLVTLTLARPSQESLDPVLQSESSTDLTRLKRSGSYDFVGGIKKSILSSIGRASASVAAGSSSSSSASKSHPEPVHHDEGKLDSWQLKKSILNTLFQAVKAITGGVTAIKGQLIKGSGYLISAKGKLIAAGGDAVTNVGKKIAASAVLVPPSPVHFAKFSGASSSSSSSSSHNTGPSGHSESFTSFEAPISVSHTSYSTHSGPSISHIAPTHHTAPASHGYLPPSVPHHSPYTSYLESPYGNNYVSTKYGPPVDAHHSKPSSDFNLLWDFPTLTGHTNSLYSSPKSQSVQSASDALRHILNKLPNKFSTDNTHTDLTPPSSNVLHHDTKIKQYEIPPDPVHHIPPFRPIGNQVHGSPVVPLFQTQSITTAYGLPGANKNNPTDTDIGKWLTAPVGPGISSPLIDSFNTYHVMSQKYGGNSHISRSHTQKTTAHETTDSQVHEQQLDQLKQTLGGNFEIQKSVGFELNANDAQRYNQPLQT